MKKLKRVIAEILRNDFQVNEKEDGTFECELYADYDDIIIGKTVAELFEDKQESPMVLLENKVFGWYEDYIHELEYEMEKKICKAIDDDKEEFPFGLSEEEDFAICDTLEEMLVFKLPLDHYLKQKIKVDIMVDTGDGNYDYVLNHVFPAYDGEYGAEIEDKASIVWLAQTQGYTKDQLQQALNEGDMRNSKGFLQSMRVEVANEASHMSMLVFLAEMTVEDVIKLNELIALQDVNGVIYDATKKPDCGSIIIQKNAETGLYDPWNGGGSIFEIELEKDVVLPIKFIRSALPDGCDGRWSISEVYAMCGSSWRDVVVKIEEPLKKSA